MSASLTAARLREVLDYDAKAGRFTWRSNRGGLAVPGAIAGVIQPHGYRRISVDGKSYYAARLAIFWITGSWPRQIVDHMNGVRNDDRWSNIREATQSQNLANKRRQINNKAKLKGVCLDKRTRRYVAQISFNRHNIFLGRFDTKEEAHAAYVTAARKYFGRFARAD